ncbi:ATP-binding protein [Streptomyces sp. RB6PN25]|uniref:histidine kinase n=1 Tax=Streptomyces humicola TaxID=2953240 RepID=A0ABT1PZ21_9ACTN|nr:ATP-binding protein [Streptomyces humicola]MCQ4082896.1 ATP-binding protein [Streptomyces humicola]
MHRRIRDEDSAPHSVRSAHPAEPAGLHTLLFLAAAVPWFGLAALWACVAPPLLGDGRAARVAAGTALAVAALLFSAVMALRARRTLSTRLASLRASARELAEHGLPHAASRMAAGQPVDTAEIVPEPQLGDDELGRTAHEIAAAQRAALALAVRQSDSRENVRKIFLNLARRTQALIHRQVALLDTMERSHEDPDLLQELFAVDHLSTRLRRHAENLVILGGALPPRQWRHGVPLMDVVRSAVSETEEYTRVEVENLPRTTVLGRAVADIVHLLAELLENGCSFSPPHSHVTITGEDVAHGLVLEIEDRGLGMPDEQYRRINTLLANASSFDSAPMGEDGRLGMFVVGRLAHRHGVNVELRRSPYGGTRVIVLLPQGLVDAGGAGAATGGAPSAPGAALPWGTAQAARQEGAQETAPEHATAAVGAGAQADQATGADARGAAAVQVAAVSAHVTERSHHEQAADRSPAAVPAQSAASAASVEARPEPGSGTGPEDGVTAQNGERRILPKRVKRASLAAQLRETAATEEAPGARAQGAARRAATPDAPAPTAEASRATMAAIQRATRLARDSEPRDAHDGRDARDIDSGGADSPAPAPEDRH